MMTKVTLPYDPEWPALIWAKEHCPSYITNKAISASGYDITVTGYYNNYDVVYYFGTEQDAMMFSLKWS